MAISTTPNEVRAISGSDALDPVINAFACAAAAILGNVAGCMEAAGITPKQIDNACTWLTAHLMAQTPAGSDTLLVAEERFENYMEKRAIAGFTQSGIKGTAYGDTANALTGGCLAEAEKTAAQIGFFGGC